MEVLSTRGPQSNLIKHVDFVVDLNIPFCADSIKNCSTILISPPNQASLNTSYLIKHHIERLTHFLSDILPLLQNPINLVIAGIDETFPNNTDLRNSKLKYPKVLDVLLKHPLINKIFVENLDCSLPNTFPIPLGINANLCPTSLQYFLKHENIDPNKPLKLTNFNLTRYNSAQGAERHYVKILCEKFWQENYINLDTIKQSQDIPLNSKLTHEMYLQSLSQYMFTVCVHGGGLDVNPKLWEALLVGSIPIIRQNKPYTDIYIDHDLPVVIVSDWTKYTINFNKLQSWYNQYYHYFTDFNKRQEILCKLSVDYWAKYVSKI